MEMQALGNGVLRKILIKEGESAPLGQLIAIIGEPDEDTGLSSRWHPTVSGRNQNPRKGKRNLLRARCSRGAGC